MKHELVLQEHDIKAMFIGSQSMVRNLIKYFSISLYIILITVALFFMSEATSKDVVLAKVVWTFSIISILIFQIRCVLKLLNSSIAKLWIIFLFSAIYLVYSIFLTVSIKILSVNEIGQASNLFFFSSGSMLLIASWRIVFYFSEKKINPLLARWNLFASLTAFLLALSSLVTHFLVQRVFILKERPDDYHPLSLALVYICGIIYVINVGSSILFYKILKTRVHKEGTISQISPSLAICLLLPVTFWYLYRFIVWPEEAVVASISLGVNLIATILILIFTFVKNLKSIPSIAYMTLIALAFSFVWMNKMIMDGMYPSYFNERFTLSISLITSSILVILVVWKSPSMSTFVASLYSILIYGIFWISGINWILEVRIPITSLPLSIPQLLDLLLVLISMIMTFYSIVVWFKIQNGIKKYLKKSTIVRSEKKHA